MKSRRGAGQILNIFRRNITSASGRRTGYAGWFAKPLIFTSGLAAGLLVYNQFGVSKPSPATSTLPLDAMKDSEYASELETAVALEKIINVVGKNNVSSESDLLDMHTKTIIQVRQPKATEKPQVIVYPSSTDEVSKVLKICHEHRVPITAYSGGTSLEGQITPVYGGISLDMSKMDKVIEIHEKDFDVVVQPAVVWQDLNEVLAPYGMFLGPDPGPGAQIGGMIGTSCSGTNAYRYGTMRQNVVNVTVVLADGSIIKTRRRPRKSSAGYDLTGLFVGAEGTLGIITEATLKLNPIPAETRVGLLAFETAKDATDTVQKILQAGINLDAIEFLDANTMKFLNKAGMMEQKRHEKHTLLLRFAGSSKTAVENQVKDVQSVSAQNNCIAIEFAKNQEESEELWMVRKGAVLSIVNSAPEGYIFGSTDVAVPISRLSQIMTETTDDLESLGIQQGIVGHVGDGNFHTMLIYDAKSQKKMIDDFVSRMTKRALDLDGTCTGEHGVGVAKRHDVVKEVGQTTVDAMRKLKLAYDPNCILNPGKVFSVSLLNDVSDN